ncbi:MAG: hypothetical protein ACYC2Y_03770 [Armatimonadota bacterium]
MKFKLGDYVKIVEREQTAADVKSGMFYPHFCGLAGTVDRIYDGEVCVDVDLETLPSAMLKRHRDIQDNIKKKWLDGLSQEARNRLSGADKQFKLAYTILVQDADLAGASRPAVSKKADEPPLSSEEIEAQELAFLKEREEALKNK